MSSLDRLPLRRTAAWRSLYLLRRHRSVQMARNLLPEGHGFGGPADADGPQQEESMRWVPIEPADICSGAAERRQARPVSAFPGSRPVSAAQDTAFAKRTGNGYNATCYNNDHRHPYDGVSWEKMTRHGR